ncbi:MAG: sulfate reduction electron transfer complex DsrMKJOP subunit DsrJ [Deltaproteobacteria bacterium]|jgi:hypothetical protein|nr:sulfate reduction electron transfer complex DsrMKJOP subunit DsrJ [Deltaproteobacteria bacterium]
MSRPSPVAVIGVFAILGLLLAPFWLNAGKPAPEPPALARPEGVACIESVAVMRTDHMRLLTAWRDLTVRKGQRTHIAGDGRTWPASLQDACLACHADKAGFCDVCHSLHAVSLHCWDCHVVKRQEPLAEKRP